MSQLLDPQTLAKLSGVKLRARAVVEGALSGLHKSPHQGQSVEFAEHKEYAPGDELRHLDWKVFGKFDRYYIKRFEHETNLRAVLALDTSASMGYQSGALSKLEVGSILAAGLAYLLVRQQDAAGISLLTSEGLREVPPRASAGHLSVLLDTLEQVKPAGAADMLAMVDRLAERVPRRSLVVVLSDLLDDRPETLKRVLALRQRKNDVLVVHLVDPAELEFPFDDPMLFLDMEGERRLEVNPREIRDSYLEEFGAFLENVKRMCREADVEYIRVRTDDRLDEVLVRMLERRGRRG